MARLLGGAGARAIPPAPLFAPSTLRLLPGSILIRATRIRWQGVPMVAGIGNAQALPLWIDRAMASLSKFLFDLFRVYAFPPPVPLFPRQGRAASPAANFVPNRKTR